MASVGGEGMASKPSTPRHSYSLSFKLEVIAYSEQKSIHQAAANFNVDRKQIREWRKKKAQLTDSIEQSKGAKQLKRLKGGGRKLTHVEIDEEVLQFHKSRREKKLPSTRPMLKRKATEVYQRLRNSNEVDLEKNFVASQGWLDFFMRRNRLSLRRKTTMCQKIPEEMADKLVDYCLYIRKLRLRHEYKFNAIYAADETAVWLDSPVDCTIESVGVKDVPIQTTGHEKLRITVMLTARADGSKCRPYVLLPRKRPIPEIVAEFGQKLVVKFEGTNWMNTELVNDYMQRIVCSSLFGGRKLLCWDSARQHICDAVKDNLRKNKIDQAVIPGGCTGFIQAPDVCWNKPFKAHFQACYNDWMENGDKEYTKGGNLRAPPFLLVCRWVLQSWQKLSTELIQNSFKSCGILNETDGSEDELIHCFKEKCPGGLVLLKKRHKEVFADGRELIQNEAEDELETRRNVMQGLEEEDSDSNEEIVSD